VNVSGGVGVGVAVWPLNCVLAVNRVPRKRVTARALRNKLLHPPFAIFILAPSLAKLCALVRSNFLHGHENAVESLAVTAFYIE
jgi:hypothetical protein